MPRLNTGPKSYAFPTIFTRANPNTVHGSIFDNNMDNSSFNSPDESLIKTINLLVQAFGGYQEQVSSNSEAACKVSL